jgi:hypothetical protein
MVNLCISALNQRAEVVDDAADLRDRLRDRRTPKLARQIVEAYVEGRCSLHAHIRLRPGGVKEIARDLCFAFEPLGSDPDEWWVGHPRDDGVPVK